MANLTRNFIKGRMNKVVDERLIPDGEYIDATNIRMGSTENSEIGVIENTKGNVALTELAYIDGTLLSADAVCIGAIDDSANETIYWFVHDPNFSVGATGKLDLILSFNVLTNILTYHIISIDDGSGVDTTLNFNPKYLITGVNKVNDLLFFTDNYNPPRFINVKKGYANPSAINVDFNNVPARLAEAILVIKKPPTEAPAIQPIILPGPDNYLETRFICFAYRYRYVDGEYSATSQWSAPAFIPNQFSFQLSSYLNDGMTNSCNAAVITYFSGGPLVVGIDLLFKQANNNIIKVIEKLDKSELGIPNFTFQTFTFDNSKIFTVLPESEILRLYDNVPLLAKAQTIMGNRLMYGNYTEGYDLIDKFGNPTRLEYQTQLVTEPVGLAEIPDTTSNGTYSISAPTTISNSIVNIDLSGLDLIAGSSISLDVTIVHDSFDGQTPFPTATTANTSFTFSFVLATSYASVYDMATSVEFQGVVGTIGTIKPVYSPIIGADTSCDGTTFTDQVNCALPYSLATPNTPGFVIKNGSGINGVGEPIAIITSPGSDIIGLQFIAMQYVDDLSVPTQTLYEYYTVNFAQAFYQKVSSPRSLHSNRGYEIAIVYMDDFNRATTALVSPNNTEHVPCGYSANQNSISVIIPTSQRAPAWATRYKFVCKADTEGYETIYTNLFFIDPYTNEAYFLLEGENMRKVEAGDRLIVKRDTGGPTTTCIYATVLEKESKSSGFITPASGAVPPAGVYMKINPSSFQVTQDENALINPGSITANEDDAGEYPRIAYGMNIPDPSIPGAYIDYTVPAGSRIQIKIKWERKGPGDGNRNGCERRIYNLDLEIVSSANYDNMYDWFVGDNVQELLNSGTQEVGGSGNCPIDNDFIPTLATGPGFPPSTAVPTSLCTNYFRFYRDTTSNALFLLITGTVRCNGWDFNDKRRSSITAEITVFRSENTLIFETEPTETLPDVFFENDVSFPINTTTGDHLSNGGPGEVDQNITLGIAGYVQTGFFNCFSFGNGAEGYKIRDSIVGKSFNLGNRVTSVSAQDYKRAVRYADITYSGVYNQENNVNKLNEFNLGLVNFSRLETSFGPIQKMDGRQTDVLVLQEDKISYVLAGKNLLSDSTGGGAVTSVPEVLGTQIARVEKYGISANPESYVQWGYDRYFTDVKRGAVIHLSGGLSSSSDQLEVVSENNMRTWFRDKFIASFNTQKLGAFDPYMDEYVLCISDRELPGNPQCLACGVSQTFTLTSVEDLDKNKFEYCVDLGQAIGTTSVVWTVSSISAGGSFEIKVDYDGTIYSSGSVSVDGQITFYKGLNNVETANITILFTGDVILNINAECPEPEELTVIEVVLTSDIDAGKTIHTQYRYTNGTFVGPLQSNLVLFQTSSSNPIISRYAQATGVVGTGSFPPELSTVTLYTNKILPDDYVFDASTDKFKYLRSSTYYPNTTAGILSLIAMSANATPIVGGPTIYSTDFTMPLSTLGNYLYLIWDLRKSTPVELCYTTDGSEGGLISLCCTCEPCVETCIGVTFTNQSIESIAQVYLPYGLCGTEGAVYIDIDPSETTPTICITNAPYYVVSGNVSVELVECGCTNECTNPCTEYAIYTTGGNSKIDYTNCAGDASTVTITEPAIAVICTQTLAGPPSASGGAIVQALNSCGCCQTPNPCMTFEITNLTPRNRPFDYRDCDSVLQSIVIPAFGSIQVCATASSFLVTSVDWSSFSITIIDPCNCVAGCTETCQSYTAVCGTNCNGGTVTYFDCNLQQVVGVTVNKGQSVTVCCPIGNVPTSVGGITVYEASTCGCCTPTCQQYRITLGGTNPSQTYQIAYRDCNDSFVVDNYPAAFQIVDVCCSPGTVPGVGGSLDIQDWTVELIDGCNCGF